jgi:hypothetical protein
MRRLALLLALAVAPRLTAAQYRVSRHVSRAADCDDGAGRPEHGPRRNDAPCVRRCGEVWTDTRFERRKPEAASADTSRIVLDPGHRTGERRVVTVIVSV